MEGCQEITRTEDNKEITEFVRDGINLARRIIDKSEPPCIIEEWYYEDKLHRDGQPAYIRHTNGTISAECWYYHGKKHRDDGPAEIWYKNGQIIKEWWYHDGKLHRVDGPALVIYEDGKIRLEEWYHDGKEHRDGEPAKISYRKNGDIGAHCWYRDGELCPIGLLASVVYRNIESQTDYWIGNKHANSKHTENIDKFRDIVKGDAIHDALRPLPIPIRDAIIPHYCYQ